MLARWTSTLVSNLDQCRLEAEISNTDGEIVAVLFEDASGWHSEFPADVTSSVDSTFLEEQKVVMSHFLNRIGLDPPAEATRGDLALWLMLRDDGTAMEMPYSYKSASFIRA